MRRALLLLFPCLLASLLLCSVESAAQTPAAADTAREHYLKGNDLYDLRRYPEAAHEYEAAFEQHPDPNLLFDIAQAYRFADDYTKAIAAYHSYLRRVPRAKNRTDVLALITDLQKLAADQRKSHDQPPNGPETPLLQDVTPSPTPGQGSEEPVASPAAVPLPSETPQVSDGPARTKRLAGWGLIGGGIAFTGVGAALVGIAYATQSSFNHPSPGKTFDPNAPGRITAEQASGGVLIGVGLAAVAAGAVLEVMGKRPTHVAWAPSFGDHQVGINLAGVWP